MEDMVGLEALAAIYKNKKVLVTGHTGFKGAWLTAILYLIGARVKGYSLAPEYENTILDALQATSAMQSVIADIRDRKKLIEAVSSFEPDFVFHLAAQPLVRRSYRAPAATFDANVTGTANLLEGVNALPGKCTVVVVTTDKVYANKEQDILYAENDELGGYDPYSASKACAELVVSSFRNSFFPPDKFPEHQKALASARAGNVIGGGDWSADRIIPDIVRSLQKGETIGIRNPHAIRPWQHVLEPLAGYLLLGSLLHQAPLLYAKPYNFGPLPEDHLTVGALVQQAIDCWGSGAWADGSDPKQPHEAGILKLNIDRARKELNWQPRLNASAAIQWTIDWYKQPAAQRAAFSFQQIRDYFSL